MGCLYPVFLRLGDVDGELSLSHSLSLAFSTVHIFDHELPDLELDPHSCDELDAQRTEHQTDFAIVLFVILLFRNTKTFCLHHVSGLSTRKSSSLCAALLVKFPVTHCHVPFCVEIRAPQLYYQSNLSGPKLFFYLSYQE